MGASALHLVPHARRPSTHTGSASPGLVCAVLDGPLTPVMILGPLVAAPWIAHAAFGASWPIALVVGLPVGLVASFMALVYGIGCAGG